MFNLKDKVKIKPTYSKISELPDNQEFTIIKIILKETDEELYYNMYKLITPLGVKFTANEFEIKKI